MKSVLKTYIKKDLIIFLLGAVVLLTGCAAKNEKKLSGENNKMSETATNVNASDKVDLRLIGEKLKQLDSMPEMEQPAILVNDQMITRKEVETLKISSQYTNGESFEERLQKVIEKKVINEEAVRLGIEPAQETVDAYMQEVKESIETNAVGTEDILEYIQGLGMTNEEFFAGMEKEAYDMFQREALRVHVMEKGINSNFDLYVENLVEDAEVVYLEAI